MRVYARYARLLTRDIPLLTRYSVHLTVLVLAIVASRLVGTDFSALIAPAAADTVATTAAGEDGQWEWTTAVSEGSVIDWSAAPETIIQENPALARQAPITYTVQEGDTPASIAALFGLQPSSIVWSNQPPDAGEELFLISTGQQLIIPPVDGIVYTVQEGDELTAIAEEFNVDPQAIQSFAGNVSETQEEAPALALATGQQLTIPGGTIEYTPPPPPPPPPTAVPQTSTAGTASTSSSSSTASTSSSSSSSSSSTASTSSSSSSSSSSTSNTSSSSSSTNSYNGAVGAMIWPATGHITQGVSWGHTALDIANSTGTAIRAADGGCIVYSGWDNTGYGYTILIDHGKLRTRYAHMSRLYYSYGDCVNRGTVIGAMGSTGNSTGPHLHFEVIIEDYGRVNPWGYLQ